MSAQNVKLELEKRGIKPDKEAVETIAWFSDSNPQLDIDEIIRDYYI